MMNFFNRVFFTAMLVCPNMYLSTAAEADVPTGNFLSNGGFESGELFPWRTGGKYTYLQEWSVTANDSQMGFFSAPRLETLACDRTLHFRSTQSTSQN